MFILGLIIGLVIGVLLGIFAVSQFTVSLCVAASRATELETSDHNNGFAQ